LLLTGFFVGTPVPKMEKTYVLFKRLWTYFGLHGVISPKIVPLSENVVYVCYFSYTSCISKKCRHFD
jgi:hypothetical protein